MRRGGSGANDRGARRKHDGADAGTGCRGRPASGCDGAGHRARDPARNRWTRMGPGGNRRGDRRGDRSGARRRPQLRPRPLRERVGGQRRIPGRRPRCRCSRPSVRGRDQGDRDHPRPRDGSPPDSCGLGDRRTDPPRRADGEGRDQPAALSVASGAAEGEEERDRAEQTPMAGRRAGEDPPQAAGAGRTHGRDPGKERRCRSPVGGNLSAAAAALMVLAFVEHVGGTPTMLSLEVLTMAGRLAREMGGPLEAVAIGPNARAASGILSSYGASTLHVADDPQLADYAPTAWARAIAELAGEANPQVVIGTASDRGGEVMAHVATRMGLPMAANCTEIMPGDPFTVTRQRWGGSLLEEAHLRGRVKLLTLAPHALTAEASPSRTEVATRSFAPMLEDKDFRVRLVPQAQADSGKISLAQARVVVGGGRGVGGAEGFASLEELADLLGGAVGCSRVVTSLGWRPHSDQVGQTGTRIAPDLYIACGISGAIQHMVGCRAAKHILAINTDPAAPIVAQADYAVIGDVQKVLAAVNTEIRKVRDSP